MSDLWPKLSAGSGGLSIPPWGLWMMLTASAVGTVLLAIQLHGMGWPPPLGAHQ